MFQSSYSKKLLRTKRPHSRSGMTLIEVVLALAVAGFLLAAATSFVVSISNIWAERSLRNFFEDHVDGVTEFINAYLFKDFFLWSFWKRRSRLYLGNTIKFRKYC